MLLEFKTKNYKCFVEEACFSMTAAPKQKGLDYSLMKVKTKGSKETKVLSSSVIYGPNAAGKTNIIGAMDVLRAIVLRGNIRNAEEKTSPNPAASMLELIPNNKQTDPKPVCFDVEFYEEDHDGNKLIIHYGMQIALGGFLEAEYPRKILFEVLDVNGERVFERTNDLTIKNLKVIEKYLSEVAAQNKESAGEIAENSLNSEELFLTNGFKLIFSPNLTKLILDWFKSVYVEKTTDKAAKLFGINSNAVGYVINEDEPEAKLFSLFHDAKNHKAAAIAADIFESYGTIRFINMFPLVIRAIQTGGTLVVDEFDASIHPMALMSIINVFHNDDVNVHHAQLIFNTHNPIFLNSNLFRRDEIKFVERDDDTHESMLYALSDFGTTGDKGVRKHEDYLSKYFISQYGAIKDIDFTPIFEEILSNEKEG